MRRPLDCKKPLHLVMRASRARGELNMLRPRNFSRVKNVFFKQAERFGVRIESFVNVGNHVHLVVRFANRKLFQNFLRTTAALVARAVTKAKKGKPFGKFWDHLAFTRVVVSYRARAILSKYVEGNRIEAEKGPLARQNFLKLKSSWEKKLFAALQNMLV